MKSSGTRKGLIIHRRIGGADNLVKARDSTGTVRIRNSRDPVHIARGRAELEVGRG